MDEIASIESASHREEYATLDISVVSGAQPSAQKVSYASALEAISQIEHHGIFMNRGQARPRPAQTAVSQPQLVDMEREKQKVVQPEVPAAVQQTVQQPQPPQPAAQPQPIQAPPPQVDKVKENAKAELKQFTKSINQQPVTQIKIKLKKVNIKDLVLPNLSLVDQVGELERIIDGLRGQMFDKDELTIVAEEIYGLAKQVEAEKKEVSKKKRELTDEEYPLWLLRDQRLGDAIKMLGINTGE